MSATLKASWGWVKALLHSVYDQPDAAVVHGQFDRVVDALTGDRPTLADHLVTARTYVWPLPRSPRRSGRRSGATRPGARQPQDPPPHRRRRHPPRSSRLIRLVGAVLAKRHNERAEMRRYIGLDILAKIRDSSHNGHPRPDTEVTPTANNA